MPEVKKTSGPVTLLLPTPLAPLSLPVGTRIQVETTMAMPALTARVKVIDGPNTGKSGEVEASEWGNIVGERT